MNSANIGPSDEELHRRIHALLSSEITAEKQEATDEATIQLEFARIKDWRRAAARPPLVEASPSGFWSELDEEERAALKHAARPRSYSSGMHLCYEGDPADHVIIIESGWTKVTSTTEDGHEVVLSIRGPGDIVGESAVISNGRRSATVTALDSMRTLVLSAMRFTAFLDEHPRIWRMVCDALVRRNANDVRRLRFEASTDSSRRLAMLLIELAEHYGAPAAMGGVSIRAPLSQSELASWVDASRETVARVLKIWRSCGLVGTARRSITVLQPAALRAYANGESAKPLIEFTAADMTVEQNAQEGIGRAAAHEVSM